MTVRERPVNGTRLARMLGVLVLAAGSAAGLGAASGPASTGQSGAGDCIAHHPDVAAGIWYAQGCTGHDEPELDPVSSLAGSAQDLTWTAVLPTDGTVSSLRRGPDVLVGRHGDRSQPAVAVRPGLPGGAVLP